MVGSEQGCDVLGRDAPAIKNSGGTGDRGRNCGGQDSSNRLVGGHGLLYRCGLTGSDRPDRFIRDSYSIQGLGGKAGQALVQLLSEYVVRCSTLPLLQRFAYAEDRAEPMFKRRSDFLLDAVVLFAEERSPFRMTQNDVPTPEVYEHRCRNLSRIGTLILPKHVLRSELDGSGRA